MRVEVTGAQSGHSLTMHVDGKEREALLAGDTVHLGLSPMQLTKGRPGDGAVWQLRPVAGALRIPGRIRLHLAEDETGVRVGPVIGIFSSRYLASRRKPITGPAHRFRQIITEARSMGALAYVFAPSGIKWRSRTIQGFTFIGASKAGRWVRGTFPFPNVVYNRVPSRRAENAPRVNGARKRLMKVPGLHLFNPKFLNKWDVYQTLKDTEVARAHIPASAAVGDARSFYEFLQSHRRVYLKLFQGSLGKGTACVELKEGGAIVWRSTKGKSTVRVRVIRGFAALKAQLLRFKRKRRYLMQAAVPLLRKDGRPFDVRALVQKRADGAWNVTGMAARIAGPGQITTHRPRGGTRGRVHSLLRHAFRDEERAEEVALNLRRAIETAATAFDDATGGNHGELSLDVGIDPAGHPWILEINAKPMVFDEPSIRKDARRRLLEYCFARSDFLPSGRESPSPDPAEETQYPAP